MIDPDVEPVREEPGGPVALLTRVSSFGEATIIHQLLASYGIPSRIASHMPHYILPMCPGAHEVAILVAARDVVGARGLLAEHLREGFRLVRNRDPRNR